MLNMVMIGVEAELSLHDPNVLWATWVERAFLIVYTLELLLRFLAGGPKLLQNSWFWLDFFLVAVGRGSCDFPVGQPGRLHFVSCHERSPPFWGKP